VHGLPTQIAAALLAQSRAAFTSGMYVRATISAPLLAGVALATVGLLRHARPNGLVAPATDQDDCAKTAAGRV
jgi:hypothetical protein